MTKVQKLKKAGVLDKDASLTKAQEKAINNLSDVEIFCLLSIKDKVPQLGAMQFVDGAGGIF